MQKTIFYTFSTTLMIFFICAIASAEMQSSNYKIPTSVFSSGGIPAGSTNYQTDSTLGQPSPLMDPSDPPSSSNYNLEPGFWYTVEETGICEGDFEPDGDVDGSDLTVLASDPGLLGLSTFAAEFGRIDCSQVE